MNNHYKYSICICNYNMGATLQDSLLSIISQVDLSYEILVVDDGSNDNSVTVLRELQLKYSNLNVICLQRDSRRKLGDTRNLSIQAAKGEYVILHIDADDLWDPFIPGFVALFNDISMRISSDYFYLSGRQIQMAKRSFMLDHPYPNLYYGEDRILWSHLASLGLLICVDHKVTRHRIPLHSGVPKIRKVLVSQYSALFSNFSTSPRPFSLFRVLFIRYLFGHDPTLSIALRIYLLSILLPAFLFGFFLYRSPRIDQYLFSFRHDTLLDLHDFESQYLSSHGRFSLTSSQRSLFLLQ